MEWTGSELMQQVLDDLGVQISALQQNAYAARLQAAAAAGTSSNFQIGAILGANPQIRQGLPDGISIVEMVSNAVVNITEPDFSLVSSGDAENGYSYSFEGSATGMISAEIDASTNEVLFSREGIVAASSLDLDSFVGNRDYINLSQDQNLALTVEQADAFSTAASEEGVLYTMLSGSEGSVSLVHNSDTGFSLGDDSILSLTFVDPSLGLVFTDSEYNPTQNVVVENGLMRVINTHADDISFSGEGSVHLLGIGGNEVLNLNVDVNNTASNFNTRVWGDGGDDAIVVSGQEYESSWNFVVPNGGADQVTLGDGVEILAIYPGSSQEESASDSYYSSESVTWDIIIGFDPSRDSVFLGEGTVLAQDSSTSAASVQSGIVEFVALPEQDVMDHKVYETSLIASQTGEVAAFAHEDSLYLFRSDGVEGWQSSDTLIELQGVADSVDITQVIYGLS
jgi:hypothetical protein